MVAHAKPKSLKKENCLSSFFWNGRRLFGPILSYPAIYVFQQRQAKPVTGPFRHAPSPPCDPPKIIRDRFKCPSSRGWGLGDCLCHSAQGKTLLVEHWE